MEDDFVKAGVADMISKSYGRHSILVFCSSVANAEKVCTEIIEQLPTTTTKIITGETKPDERAETIEEFKAESLRFLINVMVLTTGFDAPNVDCVTIFRPTVSPGLFYQMVGRGFRLHQTKRDSLILDYGGNIERHGPVDMLDQTNDKKTKSKKKAEEPVKVCEQCLEYVPIRDRICSSCGFIFPAPERADPSKESSDAAITSDQVETVTHAVQYVTYEEHIKKGSDGTHDNHFTMRVNYHLGNITTISEWVCPNHVGYAFTKFAKWWSERSVCPVPDSLEQALYLAEKGALAVPESIYVKQIPGKSFPDLVGVKLGQIDTDWTLATSDPKFSKAMMAKAEEEREEELMALPF